MTETKNPDARLQVYVKVYALIKDITNLELSLIN